MNEKELELEVVGRCFICKKILIRKDLVSHIAVYYEFWPGDHFACLDHPGVENEYESKLKGG